MAEVHLIGKINRAYDFQDRSLFLRWKMNSAWNYSHTHPGSLWKVLEGFTEGQTQLSMYSNLPKMSDDELKDGYFWDHPFDIHYSCCGIQGWPKLELEVWSVNWLGKCNISSYGFMNVPSKPGLHRIDCPTWRPVGDLRSRIYDYITGSRMQLIDPSSIINSNVNRHMILTDSMGSIELELCVILKDFDKYGIEFPITMVQ